MSKVVHQVLPTQPILSEPAFKAEVPFPGAGCLIMVIITIAATEIVGKSTGSNILAQVTFVTFVIVTIFWVRIAYRKREAEQIHNKRNEWRIQKLQAQEREAGELTISVAGLGETIKREMSSLADFLLKADAYLERAEEEFGERAYAPFWDNIEGAAKNLGAFDATLKRLDALVNQYRFLLSGRIHNFPPPGLSPDLMPQPFRQIEHFRSVVRKAQRDFEFATIWEQRETRQSIVEGFRTLGEAVYSLEARLDSSFLGFTKNFQKTADDMREEQKRLRESFEDAVMKWERQKDTNSV